MKTSLVLALLTCGSIAAQTPLAFEVASVKPSAQTGGQLRFSVNQDPGHVTMNGVNLKTVLARAYEMKNRQITGPDWLDSERFDIAGKLPEGATKEQVPEMLRNLLIERFQLAVHKEQKVAPVYALVLGKNGIKANPVEGEGNPRVALEMSPRGRKFRGDMKMTMLADVLSSMLDRPVIDQTGVPGAFKIELEYTPDGSEGLKQAVLVARAGAATPAAAPPEAKQPDGDAPSIFTAIQEQLGLRLDPKKSPLDFLIIDHIEKTPTGN